MTKYFLCNAFIKFDSLSLYKTLYLCKLARKQKEILYQGNECQNIFTCLTYMRQSYGNTSSKLCYAGRF